MRRDWAIGPVFVLRHAGMPFDWVEGLGAGSLLLAAADAVLRAEAELLSAAGPAGDPGLPLAVRTLDHRRLPGRVLRDSGDAVRRWRRAVDEYMELHQAADDAACGALAAQVRKPEVQEAVFLSNPDVYRNMLLPYLIRRGPLNARWRRTRRQLYGYLQRFCAKSETVSFFGPMAYGYVRPGDGVAVRRDRPRRREVFLSAWAARELAAAIAADRRLRTVLPFRRTGLPPDDKADEGIVAAAGDGAALPEIARATGGGIRETAVALSRLVARGAVEFGVAPAPDDAYPLQSMLSSLSELRSPSAAAHWIGVLSRVKYLLARLRDAPFPERIPLIGELESVFTDATGRPARRGAGAVYADRAVFFEECSSPFEVIVGERVARRWQREITAALELSATHGARAQAEARRLVGTAIPRGSAMTLQEYAERLAPRFGADGSNFTAGYVPTYPAGAAGAQVRELLDAAGQLPGDRYALVDICLAAADPRDLGEAPVVFSRCHHHLLTDGWLAAMAGDRHEFGAAAAAWVKAHPGLVAVDTGRRNKGYYRFPGTRIALRAPSHADVAGVLRPEQVTVARDDSGLRLTAGDGTELTLYLPLSDYVTHPPLAALSDPQVTHAVFDGPGGEGQGGGGQTPAVYAGSALYQRRRLTITPDTLSGLPPAARFLALRRLHRGAGTGRFIFCRSDTERKPYLIDLESVLAADLIAHVAGHAATLTAEEMAPDPGQLWLRDTDGNRYACELRMQVTGTDTERSDEHVTRGH